MAGRLALDTLIKYGLTFRIQVLLVVGDDDDGDDDGDYRCPVEHVQQIF